VNGWPKGGHDCAQPDRQGRAGQRRLNDARNGNSWLISDIYLDGAISEVAARRSEFAAILKNEDIDGLIAALNRKADILTGTTARSF
jgi:hypothetical protein